MNGPAAASGRKLKILGISLILLGAISIFAPVFAGSAVVIIIGAVLLVAGISQIVQGIKADSRGDKMMSLILGAITAVAGIFVIGHPLLGLSFLTLILALYFLFEGIWKVASAFSYRPVAGWNWMLLSGVLSVILGLLIWYQWPVSGMWAVGVLIGIDLLSTGISMVVLASALRHVSAEAL